MDGAMEQKPNGASAGALNGAAMDYSSYAEAKARALRAASEAEFEQTPTIGALAAALALAQDEMENAAKDSKNPHFNSKYADLASVRAAAKPIYKQGLATVQQVISKPDGSIGVRTVLAHKSGEWMASRAYVKPDKSGPQAAGSVITYLRRYMLAAALGIAQEDDDGNGAGNGRNTPPQQPSPRAPAPAPAAAPAKEKPWMKRLQAAVSKLKLGEARAEADGLKGKERDDRIRGARLLYLTWCAGRDITSTHDLTDAEAAEVIKRAEAGETP